MTRSAGPDPPSARSRRSGLGAGAAPPKRGRQLPHLRRLIDNASAIERESVTPGPGSASLFLRSLPRGEGKPVNPWRRCIHWKGLTAKYR
jgi:hypothetical protein